MHASAKVCPDTTPSQTAPQGGDVSPESATARQQHEPSLDGAHDQQLSTQGNLQHGSDAAEDKSSAHLSDSSDRGKIQPGSSRVASVQHQTAQAQVQTGVVSSVSQYGDGKQQNSEPLQCQAAPLKAHADEQQHLQTPGPRVISSARMQEDRGGTRAQAATGSQPSKSPLMQNQGIEAQGLRLPMTAAESTAAWVDAVARWPPAAVRSGLLCWSCDASCLVLIQPC